MAENVLFNEGESQYGSRADISLFTTIPYSSSRRESCQLQLHANRRTPLQHLPPPVRKYLACFLEIEGEWTHGWKGLAVQLHYLMLSEGIDIFVTPSILHIESRSRNYSSTPFEFLISECEGNGRIFVEHLIKAIYATENQPALTVICEAYLSMSAENDHRLDQLWSDGSESKNKAANPQDGPQRYRKQNNSFRNLFETEGGRIVRNRNSSGADSSSSEAAAGCFEVRPTNSSGGSSESLQSSRGTEDNDQSDRASVESVAYSIQRLPFSQAGERGVRVFLTYSCSNRHRMITVNNMAKCLRENQFSVEHEASNQLQLAQDKLGWLDATFRNAHFILVLITPEYAQDVMNVASQNLVIDPSDRALNSRYIYKLMQSEYFMNKCINRRFIPVLMPAVRDLPETSRDLVPNWLRLTLVYRWPVNYRDIFSRMIRPDKIMRDLIAERKRADAKKDIYVSRS